MDKHYWDKYYDTYMRKQPSLFAQYVADNFLSSGKRILDLGCGDGADSILFMNKGLMVDCIDQSIPQQFINEYSSKINIIREDFTKYEFQEQYDYVYMRFILHAIDDKEESSLLSLLPSITKQGGLLLIEARSVKNELYKLIPGRNLIKFHDNHRRRFIITNELRERVKRKGFRIKYAIEDSNFSPSKNDNQIFLRLVAVKLNE